MLLPLLLSFLLLPTACGDDTPGAKTPADAGIPDDAGVPDAGGPGGDDAGDAGDAGEPGDAGDAGDAGEPSDAGDAGDGGGTDGGPPADPAEPLFSGNHISRFEINLSQEALAALKADPDEYVEGALHLQIGVQSIDLPKVGVRLKGQLGSFRPLNQKAAFVLKFDKFADQNLFGLKKLTLNNMVQDPSMIHERLGYALFRAMEVPAPRAAHATIRINGALYGLYTALESTDNSVFLKRWFGSNNGNLYEGQYGSDLYLGMEATFEQDKGEDVGFADLTELAKALDQMTDPATFLEEVAQVIDIDSYLRFAATELFIGHWDGYVSYRNNFYLYRRPSDERWVFIPWGIDQTFGRYIDTWSAHGRIQRMCTASLPCRYKLAQAYEQVLLRVADLSMVDQAMSLGTFLWTDVQEDPRKEVDVGTVFSKMTEAIDFLKNRPTDVRLRLGCVDPANCERCTLAPAPNGGQLAFCTETVTWAAAEADCVTQGGHLVSIHDQATQTAVRAGARALSIGPWWVGLSDEAEEGTFAWSDKTSINFTLWATSEPNNQNNEDCVQLYGEAGTWNDVTCAGTASYVCTLPPP
ncbi:CotH kinase family protein [Stigmatella sp. ncwal1]|uniref:CotH kinase family protein n=1 Tax=Stigmatella ashevillensis TaxID=2995309 RepID=A0ABT5DEF7_9BACT|nr:CotH kinase family protein [Stigmatella ashevillena]MDC0710701.1 CotH kinase family protein [Stigmatella ashevillena]